MTIMMTKVVVIMIRDTNDCGSESNVGDDVGGDGGGSDVSSHGSDNQL